jgi:LacI family transcriptional regulator
MAPQTTLKDIAFILKLSISTVSKALNNSDEISAETREKVTKLAQSLNYVPNETGRSLKLNKTFRIGIIIPNLTEDFFAKVLQGVELAARKYDYKVIICLTDDTHIKEAESVSFLINGAVDGLLLSLSKETQNLKNFSHLENIVNRNFPLVMFDRITEDIPCDKIIINDFEAGFEATNFLAETNCKNIAFLTPISETSVSELRKEGYMAALENKNLKHPIIIEIPSYERFESILEKVLGTQKIDAIIASDQFSAFCTINFIQKIGLKVPEDICVIGFADGLLPKFMSPSLTTVHQKEEEMGELALKTIIARIESKNKTPFTRKVIKSELIKRQSTKEVLD